jgi:predicted GNAT family acetyltransferase
MDATVRENVEEHRFELPIADGVFAAAYYRVDNGNVVLIHTEVPTEYSGQGFASRLAEGTFELLRKSGRKAVLRCPFMVRYFAKHPEFAEVVAG